MHWNFQQTTKVWSTSYSQPVGTKYMYIDTFGTEEFLNLRLHLVKSWSRKWFSIKLYGSKPVQV